MSAPIRTLHELVDVVQELIDATGKRVYAEDLQEALDRVEKDEDLPSAADVLGILKHVSSADDPALDCAIDILDGTICECGHTESAHVFDPDECHGESADGCERGCRAFRPVEFIVGRANEPEAVDAVREDSR